MASIGNLVLKMTLQAGEMQAQLQKVTSQLDAFRSRVTGLAAGAVGGLAGLLGIGSVAGGLGLGIQLAKEAEQMQIAFATMFKSADKAREVIADIRKFAVETPFEMPELVAAGRQLAGYGVAADRLVGSLRMLGEISSATGAPIGDLAYLFGTLKTQGQAYTRDITQFAGRGIPIWDALGKVFNKTTAEMHVLVEEGKVGFADVNEALQMLTDKGGAYAGATENQSKTLAGLWSTLKDNVTMALMDIGQAIVENFDLKEATKTITNMIGVVKTTLIPVVIDAIKWLKDWSGVILKTITVILAITAAVKLWTMAKAISLALSGPSGWAILATGLVVAAGATYALGGAFSSLEAAMKKANAEAEKKAGTQGTPLEQAMRRRTERLQDIEEEVKKVEAQAARVGIPEQGRGITLPNSMIEMQKKWGNEVIRNSGNIEHQNELLEQYRARLAIAQGAIEAFTQRLADMKRIQELGKVGTGPLDAFARQANELLRLEQGGQPLGRVFDANALKLIDDLEKAVGGIATKGPEALMEGSKEAAQAIIRAQRLPRESAEDRLRRILELGNDQRKELLKFQAEAARALRKLADEGLVNELPI